VSVAGTTGAVVSVGRRGCDVAVSPQAASSIERIRNRLPNRLNRSLTLSLSSSKHVIPASTGFHPRPAARLAAPAFCKDHSFLPYGLRWRRGIAKLPAGTLDPALCDPSGP